LPKKTQLLMELCLKDTGCHMGSHSVTCHPIPHLNRARQASKWFTYPRGMEGWVDLGGWLHTKMVCLSPIQVVTRPSMQQFHWLMPML